MSVALGALLLSLISYGAAAPQPTLVRRQGITQLTSAEISRFKPFTFFAAAGYCQPDTTLSWTCGANCEANADFVPTASGGDGADVQFWFVGYSPSLASVIVSHQGTDPSEIESLATDADAFFDPLDTTLFPGLSSDIEAHSGFVGAHAETAADVLAAVQQTLADNSATKVTTVGHSLGAAISLLESVYLPLHIPDVSFEFIGYGLPRVGNQAFADYIDSRSNIPVTRINNKQDFVPILPGRFLDYHHSSGEIHIDDSNAWNVCPGQDNEDPACTVGDIGNIFEGDTDDHSGPYDGVRTGC